MSSSSKNAFSKDKNHNGSFLVYVNGIHIPVESSRVKYGVWEIPEASIDLAPDPVLQRLGAEDRVQVAIFFIDDFTGTTTPRLLMEGEITGWSTSLRAGGLGYSFQIINQIAVFTQLFVQFLTNVDDITGHAVAPSQGVAGIAPTRSEIVFPYSFFTQGLIGTDFITRPFDFLYNVVINMTGSKVPAEQRSVPVVNFFTRWSRLTNFLNRFVATPTFDDATSTTVFPILKSLQTVSALDVLTRALIPYVQQLQNAGSIWDTLQLVFQAMLSEVAMIPTAPLVSVDLKTNTIIPTTTERKLVDGKPATLPDPLKPNRLLNYFVKPQFIFGLPPACNVIFPSMLEMFQYSENYATQATRLYFNNEVLHQLFKIRGQLDPTIMSALAIAWPPVAQQFQKAKASNLKGTGKNFLIFPEEFFKGPVMDTRIAPTWLFFLKQAEMTSKGASDDVAPNATPKTESSYPLINTSNSDVYALYAEYEYYRERYSRRAGVAICKFNPYILPGFPAIIFDNQVTKMYLFCYVTSVEHNHTSRSVQTTVSYSYGRTIFEVMDLLRVEFENKSTAIASAPKEPISQVSEVIQHFGTAEAFYQALLFGKMPANPQEASCQWFKLIGYAPENGETLPESIFITGSNDSGVNAYNDAVKADSAYLTQISELQLQVQKLFVDLRSANNSNFSLNELAVKTSLDVAQIQINTETAAAALVAIGALQDQITALEQKRTELKQVLDAVDPNNLVRHNLVTNRELVPTPAFEDAFTSYDAAMKYASRPICSLDEYIIFLNSAGENPVPAFGTPGSVGTTYYERIRRFVPLTDTTKLPIGADGAGQLDVAQNGSVVPGLDPTFPQTRADWDSILLAYRNNVLNTKVPRG